MTSIIAWHGMAWHGAWQGVVGKPLLLLWLGSLPRDPMRCGRRLPESILIDNDRIL